jgi:hypothetical protein
LIGSWIVLRDISTKLIVTPPDGRSRPPIHIKVYAPKALFSL